MGLAIFLLGSLIPVPSDLRGIYTESRISWAPYFSQTKVEWCQEECPEVLKAGNLVGYFQGRVIYLDRNGIYGEGQGFRREEGMKLVLEHEIGHSLGLDHSLLPGSIMRMDWKEPIATRPSQEDLIEAGRKQHPVFDK